MWPAAVAGALLLILGAVVWAYARSRYVAGKTETEAAILKLARERRHNADEVMAEPVADEERWLLDVSADPDDRVR